TREPYAADGVVFHDCRLIPAQPPRPAVELLSLGGLRAAAFLRSDPSIFSVSRKPAAQGSAVAVTREQDAALALVRQPAASRCFSGFRVSAASVSATGGDSLRLICSVSPDKSVVSSWRARETRLLIVPTAQLQILAASS